jgi:hypothetical protein
VYLPSNASRRFSREGVLAIRHVSTRSRAREQSYQRLHDVSAVRFRIQGEPDVAAPQGGMACERKFPLRCEYANAIGRAGRPWLQEKARLTKVGPIGKCGHLPIGQRICAGNDGQRIAAQRMRCALRNFVVIGA